MPWHALGHPSLAIGVLSSACQIAGFDAPVEHHLGLRFADFLWERSGHTLTPSDYTTVVEQGFVDALGDWVFAGTLNGDEFGVDALREYAAERRIPMRKIVAMRDLAGEFVDIVVEEMLACQPDLVGFTSTFMQNVASLAVAARLKRSEPDIKIVFGGGNCDGPMGIALQREFPFVDLVLRGEADETFPHLLTVLAEDRPLTEVPGLSWWDGDRQVVNKTPARLVPPIAMHRPDYDRWFAAFDASVVSEHVQPEIAVESARGCWWGEHHHCTFCGLNGTSMTFRAKQPETFVAEVEHLVRRHRVLDIVTVDNILEPNYLRTALPALARTDWDLRLHYEVKANLTHAQIQVLRDAGVYSVQPGIESLIDDVLARMDKGVRAVHNIRVLRDCGSTGLTVAWNWLYGFPGEQEADYRRVISQVPALVHLQPPEVQTRIQLNRFSPHFENLALGFADRRPAAAYGHVYDIPAQRLADMVYMFDTAPSGVSDEFAALLADAVGTWQADHAGSTLVRRVVDDVLVLRDRRAGWSHEDHLIEHPRERQAWLHLEHGRSAAGLARKLADDGMPWDIEDVSRWLAGLAERGLVLTEGGRWVALATTARPLVAEAAGV
jgi:ribosomal peptide maturation radical SAM protein 1